MSIFAAPPPRGTLNLQGIGWGGTMASEHGTGGARSDDICFRSLRELARLLRGRHLSAREVMTAHLEQIRRWNPRLNAIVAKLDDESCLALADAADARAARGDPLGALHGLPWAFKDLEPAIGFPWTRGSPIFRNDRPTADSVLVERLRQAGVVPIGKTNTPEFGMGSHTYNRVYGTTVNPYDLTKSAGGSSGGAAASVASGMLPAADGSDLGGSLRNPGNFNNVVGFRPTVGLVPTSPTRCRCLDSRLRDQLPVPCRTLATYLPRWRGLILGIQAVPRRIRLCSRGP